MEVTAPPTKPVFPTPTFNPPSPSKINWKILVIGAIIIAVAVAFIATLYKSGLVSSNKSNPVQSTLPKQDTNPQQATQAAQPPKVVCRLFNNLDEALKQVDIACVVDLSGKDLGEVPQDLTKLIKLNELRLNKNKLTQIPTSLTTISTLMSLDLSDNQISQLPLEIKNLTNLQLLDLSNNQLTSLPDNLQSVTSLHTLKLSGNNFSDSEKEKIKVLLSAVTVEF